MKNTQPRYRRGMLLGKFMPPHQGHQLLVDMARQMVEELVVLVCSIEREPIDGALRFRWMEEIFGGMQNVRLVHVTDEVPQEPGEHPLFWEIWRELVLRYAGAVDVVFASEDYGFRLAEELSARFLPVDRMRLQVPVSASAIRENPMANWSYIPEAVRPHFVRRVCIFGPESTGKTTLSRRLAAHFETKVVAEYARDLLEPKRGVCAFEDIELIAGGQIASEEALARQANRVLICDTDPLTTTVWSEFLFKRCPGWLREAANQRQYDLTLLCDVDVPWVDDGERYLPEERREFMTRCAQALREADRNYLLLQGDYEQRFEKAKVAVNNLLSPPQSAEPRRRRESN